MKHTIAASTLAAVLALGCQPAPLVAPPQGPAPGAGMGCGVRGRLVDGHGQPRVFAGIFTVSRDARSRDTVRSDHEGRFALPGDCQRLLAVASETADGIAAGLVWVEDAAVDLELRLPRTGDLLTVRALDEDDAARQRVLELVAPTLDTPHDHATHCDARTNELRRLRASAREAATRQLAAVALMAAPCSPCPGAAESAELAGALTADRGLAEAWPAGYGRLFACSPGPHPHEAKFERTLGALDRELAARVVYSRSLEAAEQSDRSSAERLAQALERGVWADTEFARGLRGGASSP